MKISVSYQGDELWLIELPDNTKSVEFDIDPGKDWNDKVAIKKIEFYGDCEFHVHAPPSSS